MPISTYPIEGKTNILNIPDTGILILESGFIIDLDIYNNKENILKRRLENFKYILENAEFSIMSFGLLGINDLNNKQNGI